MLIQSVPNAEEKLIGLFLERVLKKEKKVLIFNIIFAGMETMEEWDTLELLDPTIRGSFSRNEVIRCIHIGLLCVQENPTNRVDLQWQQ